MARPRSTPGPRAKAGRPPEWPASGLKTLVDEFKNMADRALGAMLLAIAERDQLRAERDELKARIAVLEARPDPPERA